MEELGCFGGRRRGRGHSELVGKSPKQDGDVGPCENLGLRITCTQVRFLPSRWLWGTKPSIQMSAGSFWQPWVFSGRHLLNRPGSW